MVISCEIGHEQAIAVCCVCLDVVSFCDHSWHSKATKLYCAGRNVTTNNYLGVPGSCGIISRQTTRNYNKMYSGLASRTNCKPEI